MAIPIEYLDNAYYSNEINGFNLNYKSTILLDSIINLAKEYFVNTDEIYIDPNLEINNFKEKLKDHLDNLYTFIDIIYQIKFFSDEFHKGQSVKNIANYILNNNQLSLENISFLLDLIDKFIELSTYKAINMDNLSDSEIKNNYNKLSVDSRKYERYFYSYIYQPSKEYDEGFLDEMSNLLVR